MALFLLVILVLGCASVDQKSKVFSFTDNNAKNNKRMLIWNASLSLEVYDLRKSVQDAIQITKNAKGYVEKKSNYGEKSVSLTLRVPSDNLKPVVKNISEIGEVTSEYVSSKDVTEEYIDVDTRLKNKIILRDKLKKLLDKAKDVQDILAIEKELNRVQSDIDSMQGRINSLKSKVDFAELSVSFHRKPILGPLGYLFKGVWWGFEKMFVIRK